MSTSVSILGAAVVFAAAQLLLRKDSPSYAFLLSISAAVFILLRLGAAAQDLMRGVWALSRRVDGTAFSCLLRCAGILLITDYARTPVSYTHLDVYKRQIWRWERQTCKSLISQKNRCAAFS